MNGWCELGARCRCTRSLILGVRRDMKLHRSLLGWSCPDQALLVAAGILGKHAFGGLGISTAEGVKPSRQCSRPGSLNLGAALESDGTAKRLNTRKHRN
jgi:hypothetical protein